MSADTYSGKTLDGKYRLTTLLGKGGMGSVYKGEHIIIGKTVAIKFLHSELAQNEEVVKRFYREAQAAAAIGHDAIIDVLDVGISPKGEPYLVMEYLEGESLGEMLARTGPMELGAACAIMEPALLALNAAHIKGIVHRDLKPDNIFIVRQENAPPKIKLIDFGISKFIEGVGGEKLTQTGSVMGTPAYMAPEQARGSADLDHRADIYSMGVIFYEMLTAKLPFNGSNFTEIIISILTEDPVPPLEAFEGFPVEAQDALLRSLNKDPADRYQNALEFVEALRGLAAFDGRQDKLTRIAAAANKITFAGGSLGDTSGGALEDSQVAANVLSQVAARQGTPAGWTQTKPASGSQTRTLLLVIAAAAIITIGGVITAVLVSGNSTEPTPGPIAPGETPTAPQPTSVTISVEGAPDGAHIFFDDMLVTINPFTVKRADSNAILRVEKDGFEPFVASVMQNADQKIVVSLKPGSTDSPSSVASEKSGSAKSSSRPKKKKKTSKSSAAQPPASTSAPEPKTTKPPKKKSSLQKGAKGTKMADKFE